MQRAPGDDHGDDIGPQLDELYGAPPDEFVATRDRLVRALRASDRREDAKALAARRRPTQTADALNRLARSEREALRQFFALAEPLSAAQVGGRGGDAEARERLRTLDDERRRRTDQLTDAAVTLAGPSGEQHREEFGRALAAALADPAVARTLSAGRLERVPDTSAGFDALAAAFAARPEPVARAERGARVKGGKSGKSGKEAKDNGGAPDEGAPARSDELHARRARLTAARDEERAARAEATAAREELRLRRADLKRAEKAAAAAEQRVERAERERRRLTADD